MIAMWSDLTGYDIFSSAYGTAQGKLDLLSWSRKGKSEWEMLCVCVLVLLLTKLNYVSMAMFMGQGGNWGVGRIHTTANSLTQVKELTH